MADKQSTHWLFEMPWRSFWRHCQFIFSHQLLDIPHDVLLTLSAMVLLYCYFLDMFQYDCHLWCVLFPRTTSYIVYPKKYAHGFCFAVLCCGYTLTGFPISIRPTSLALWQSNDCPSASKATLMNMDKYIMWIHDERLHNHNKAKHNKTVCIFLGIYCTMIACISFVAANKVVLVVSNFFLNRHLAVSNVFKTHYNNVIMSVMASQITGDRLLNRLFRRRPKKKSKLCVSGLCEGKSPVSGEFPLQRANNAEMVSIFMRCVCIAAMLKTYSIDDTSVLPEYEYHFLIFYHAVLEQRGNMDYLQLIPPWIKCLQFKDGIFKSIYLNEKAWLSIKIPLKFVPKGPINNSPALVQIMAWRRPGDKPLSEPMMTRFTDAYMRHWGEMS